MNRIYYNQADSRWANHPYPSSSHPNATIKSGGCGATSAAMIVSSFRQLIYPDEMGDIFRANGLRAAEGTSPSAFPWIAKTYGLKCKTTPYINDAVECLRRGGMCVAYCKAGGLFSTGGHIIVLADIRGDNLVVYDPYLYAGKFNSGNRRCVKVNGVEAIVSVSNFKKYCDYTLYCYEYDNGGGGTPKYSPGQYVEINDPINICQDNGGDKLFVDNGLNQFWINRSVVKNNKIIARVLVVWVEEKKILVEIFGGIPDQAVQFWVDTKNIVKIL